MGASAKIVRSGALLRRAWGALSLTLQAQEGIQLKVTIDQSKRRSCLPKFSPV